MDVIKMNKTHTKLFTSMLIQMTDTSAPTARLATTTATSLTATRLAATRLAAQALCFSDHFGYNICEEKILNMEIISH
jgi:hypothetical protein